jgi:hypothetical protein
MILTEPARRTTMKREEYLKQSLKDLQAELVHQTDFIKGIKKNISEMQRAGCKPADSFDEVIAQAEATKESLTGAIKKLEEALKAKK